MSNGVDKDYLIQLINELYRLTLLFPKKEPLRYKMRELADDVLANLILVDRNPFDKRLQSLCQQAVENLEILDSYFAVAIEQNWISPPEIFSLQEEYAKIRDWFKRVEQEKPKKESSQETLETPKLPVIELGAGKKEGEERMIEERKTKNPRQEKILEILKDRGKAQVWEIQKIFPDVTKRTLRRDFKYLLKQEIIQRMGERNETFYQLKPQ